MCDCGCGKEELYAKVARERDGLMREVMDLREELEVAKDKNKYLYEENQCLTEKVKSLSERCDCLKEKIESICEQNALLTEQKRVLLNRIMNDKLRRERDDRRRERDNAGYLEVTDRRIIWMP